ncbi:phage portal protein, HK97 family [Clostridium sp. DSM 8431]|uniref:phage portal protein n=1 Tax=Clostridium sp. DSM 8431 TaxID=1761781 RepID=UPI0008E6F6E7|nr:phage portal protein [Clostridium sp. DSM 8431]SFU42892.1 phage portal protein, HK97 family [Clostridium sp. DSM 8431]
MKWPWSKKKEERGLYEDLVELYTLLQTTITEDNIDREKAMNIPTVSGCIRLIQDTVKTCPIKLFHEVEGKVQEIKGDPRLSLLNDDTKDTLNAAQFWEAMIEDFYLEGNSYAYINKQRNQIKSLHYVEESAVSINSGIDPIFKDYDIWVNGEMYKPYEFLKITRRSKDGVTGRGILETNKKILAVAYNSLIYENILAKTGGNKKGFIKAESKLDRPAINELKEQWNKMYSQNSENCIVLNKGLSFQESAATSTGMQMNENKITNADEICKLFVVPPTMLGGDGKANDNDYEKFIKLAVLPLLRAILAALNKDFLLEKEKSSFYFGFDVKELLKGDIEKRFRAYEIGIKNKDTNY